MPLSTQSEKSKRPSLDWRKPHIEEGLYLLDFLDFVNRPVLQTYNTFNNSLSFRASTSESKNLESIHSRSLGLTQDPRSG